MDKGVGGVRYNAWKRVKRSATEGAARGVVLREEMHSSSSSRFDGAIAAHRLEIRKDRGGDMLGRQCASIRDGWISVG